MNDFFFLAAAALISFVLIFCQRGEASSGDDFTASEKAGVVFQNSVFHYYSKEYILSAFQFSTLLEDFPEFRKGEVLGYYLSSLSFLGQGNTVMESLEKYKNILGPGYVFTIADNFQKRGDHKAALDALESVRLLELSRSLLGKYYFLKARSYIALNYPVKAFDSLGKIDKSSVFYIAGRLMQSRLHYKMRETEKAVRVISELLENKSIASSGSRGEKWRQEAELLLGQIWFDKGEYSKSLSCFSKVGEGEYFPFAVEGVSWVMIETGAYRKAEKKLELLQRMFPRYFYGRELPVRLLLVRYYAGERDKTMRSLEEVEEFIDSRGAFAKKIMASSDLARKYMYYLLENFSGIKVIEKYSLAGDDIKLFQLLKPGADLIAVSGAYNLLTQVEKESVRGLNLFNGYTAVFKKRRELFKSFIDTFRYLRPSYLSLKKTIMEIEIPFDKITEKNVRYVSTSLDAALKEYAGKFRRPLTKLESQLVKILVYEEYISTKGLERNLPLFTLTLKMMKTLQGLYGESENGWKDEFNIAVDEHNKSVRMINRLNNFPVLGKELKKLKSDITSMITAYIRKEAYRMILRNRQYKDIVNAVREDLRLPAGTSDGNGAEQERLSTADEIELFLKGRISLLDNYSSELLLLLSDRLFEQEFTDGKNLYPGSGQDAGNYFVSYRKTIDFLDEIIKKRGDDRFVDRFLYLRGYCYLEQGEYETALRDFARIEEEFPESPLFSEVTFRIAEYYFSSGQLALAIEMYEKTLLERGSPYYDKALYKLGWAYYLASNFPEAISYFTRLAEVSYGVKKGETADMTGSEGAELGSEDLSNEGLIYAAVSYTNTGGAREVLKKVAGNIKPYSKILLGEIAHAYFEQSRYADFIIMYKAFGSIFKNVPPDLEMEKRVVNIREAALGNEGEALRLKELFVDRYYPDASLSQAVRYRDRLNTHLRPMIRELASFFHKRGVNARKKEFFKKACGYYSKYLDLYGKEKDAGMVNLYYAESLYEFGDYLSAASEFDKISSVDFGDISANEKALYGAVASLEKFLKNIPEGSSGEKRASVEKKLVAAEKKYIYIFPESQKSGPLYFRLGRRLFGKMDYAGAIVFFKKAAALLSDKRERSVAFEYLADSYFNIRKFYNALDEYQKLLLRARKAGDLDSELKAREYISRANVNIAEELTVKGKVLMGAARYEMASESFMDSEDKERVLAKAMRLYISVRSWDEFERVFRNYSYLYPESDNLEKTVFLAANSAHENFDFVISGKYFERLASFKDDPEEELKILVLAARDYERGGEIKNAIRVFTAIYHAPSIPEARQLEFRFKAAELLKRDGKAVESEKLYREVVALYRKFAGLSASGIKKGGSNSYFFGKASLRLLQKPFEEFVSNGLLQPFSVNFPKRLDFLGEMVKGFMEIARLGITEFSTQSLYRTGYLFESFRKSIIESSLPPGLNEEEKEEYSFMLEEKAFPYEERSVRAYEKSVSIGRENGVSNMYIDLCYERLAEISPAVYRRDEDIFVSKVVPLEPSFGFTGKIDLEIFNRERDEFSFESNRIRK